MSTTSLSQNIFKITFCPSKTTNGSATIRIRYLIHTSSYGQQAAPYIENFLENPDFVKFPDAISRSTRKLECFEGRKMDDDDALKDVCHSWCIYSKCGAVHGVQHNPSHHKGAATKLCIRPFYERRTVDKDEEKLTADILPLRFSKVEQGQISHNDYNCRPGFLRSHRTCRKRNAAYDSIWDTVETGFDPRSADFRRARSSDRQLKLLTKKL
ncbi:hypothetical protein QR680_011674 [Steinernema hermaphroditum]|uniref:Uncharacterized protein n=1 Tax=Steinernema hermaphroditum TaxID=289476 RepID=A0AA39I135_9BILA|nr:hypothetical protein QR680_011674 [Steinernema hermaphroditum]